MKTIKMIGLTMLLLMLAPPVAAVSAEESPGPKRASVLMGNPPVNINIASAGTLPESTLFTALNASFSDKHRGKDGGSSGFDTFAQIWLLKVRYGITSNLELSTVGSYANMSRRNPSPNPSHIEGLGDQSLGLSYGLFNVHQGDPLSLSFGLSAILPTAPEGSNHAPGNSAWGGRAHVAVGKWLTRDLKFDTELVFNTPFERGNQDVKRGSQYMWSAQLRYLFNEFDIAFESNVTKTESGDKDLPNGRNINIRNGYTEWYVGPSLNVAFEPVKAWMGVGVFFPVYQDVKGPTKVDDARFEFKIGKLW